MAEKVRASVPHDDYNPIIIPCINCASSRNDFANVLVVAVSSVSIVSTRSIVFQLKIIKRGRADEKLKIKSISEFLDRSTRFFFRPCFIISLFFFFPCAAITGHLLSTLIQDPTSVSNEILLFNYENLFILLLLLFVISTVNDNIKNLHVISVTLFLIKYAKHRLFFFARSIKKIATVVLFYSINRQPR